ncbi:INO80 [Symbiodinium sp. CCMP2592]|nr:INO80 [Symbiodinium sp. CCMP2592]
MKRRKKEEVLSLPPKIFHDVWLPMSPLQVQWYRRILSLKNTQMSRDIRSLKKLILRLRNVCIHPRLAVASKEDEEFMLSMGVCSQEEIEQLKDGPLVSEEIIGQSYKLAFVDALLTHLHAQNMGLNDNWRKTFEAEGPELCLDLGARRQEGQEEFASPVAKASFLDGMEHVDWDTPQPHKVLIFCQHQNCMDLLEAAGWLGRDFLWAELSERHLALLSSADALARNFFSDFSEYCKFRGYRYMRMDGSTNRVLRELDMRDFNAVDEDVFIYLISTRAGGLGVNLASANHVVLFEQDWNPHVDHQAIDRAHRIGQSRQVHIHRPIQAGLCAICAFCQSLWNRLEGLLQRFAERVHSVPLAAGALNRGFAKKSPPLQLGPLDPELSQEWAVEERLLIRSNAKLEMATGQGRACFLL